MQIKIKPLLSAITLGVFISFALASELLDESTNTEITAESCQHQPDVSGTLTINVEYLFDENQTAAGVKGTIFITHQIIMDTIECLYDPPFKYSVPFTFDSNGKFSYTTPTYLHDNLADLFRVEVNVPADDDRDFDGFRAVRAATYNQAVLNIKHVELESL